MRGSGGSSFTPKARMHAGRDVARSAQQVRTAGAAMVDQHERVLVRKTNVAIAVAREAGLLDQYAADWLALAVVGQPLRQAGMRGGEAARRCRRRRDSGKAAGVADQRRLGSLRVRRREIASAIASGVGPPSPLVAIPIAAGSSAMPA